MDTKDLYRGRVTILCARVYSPQFYIIFLVACQIFIGAVMPSFLFILSLEFSASLTTNYLYLPECSVFCMIMYLSITLHSDISLQVESEDVVALL